MPGICQNTQQYVDTKQAAVITQHSVSWLAHARPSGIGPRFIITEAGRVLYDVDDLKAWLNSRKRGPIPQGTAYVAPKRRRGRPTKAEQIARRAATISLHKEG